MSCCQAKRWSAAPLDGENPVAILLWYNISYFKFCFKKWISLFCHSWFDIFNLEPPKAFIKFLIVVWTNSYPCCSFLIKKKWIVLSVSFKTSFCFEFSFLILCFCVQFLEFRDDVFIKFSETWINNIENCFSFQSKGLCGGFFLKIGLENEIPTPIPYQLLFCFSWE